MSKMQRAQLGTTGVSRTHLWKTALPHGEASNREGRIAMPFGSCRSTKATSDAGR